MYTNITPREKEVLENMAKAISDMSDFRKGEFLGYARAMLDLKRQRNCTDIPGNSIGMKAG